MAAVFCLTIATGDTDGLFGLLLGEKPDAVQRLTAEEQELMLSVQCISSLDSPSGNSIAVVLSAVECKTELPRFEQLLCTMTYPSGPFIFQVWYAVLIGMASRTTTLHERGLLARALDLDRALGLDQAIEIWEIFLGQSELHGPVLDILCQALDLQPLAQWWEALRLRWLPRVPERITLMDPAIWAQTRQAFTDEIVDDSNCRHAASQLLLDTWLYLTGGIDALEESPFAELATLTRSHPSAPLQVAHCLRDLVYGDAAREEDLVHMVESDKPTFRKLFEGAFWRDRTTDD
jgi:hypothetical protein